MMNYKKIAVAIDFSKQSLLALDRAIRIAVNNDAELLLVNVIDTKTFGSIAAYDLTYAAQLKQESTEKLQQLKAQAESDGVKHVTFLLAEGSPKKILTTLAETELIICGETGYNAIEKLMLGSVAERVVRYAPYDVLIVR
jgi:nucleotide-binding universal stress UspA family protein